MAENEVFDVDALADSYQPVRIKFRGNEYTLGTNVLQVMAAAELSPDSGGMTDMVPLLPTYLRTLCPEIAPALEEPLTAAEEVALMRPITAVMDRFNAIVKSEKDEGEQPDAGDAG